MRTSNVKKDILDYLAARPDENAFLRSEFDSLSKSRSGVDKALRALVKEGMLVRGGYGVLVRGMYNDLVNQVTPTVSADKFAREVLCKLDIPFRTDSARLAYNRGETTQVPAWLAVNVGKGRISRKIGYNKRWLNYERA
ncbi:hypothetical protein HAQ01_05250 [Acidithiobacillus thiooxidans]|uniref:hypothetical protein n=1 Tax=Acidithiobacillus thiooxidans TaxID=930 RepID=UPI001C072756|nr:hypothetical protein [Acidithiobacillus thiooxidans]MBU2792800.1 hypothetical protein [Acidithiobacillus thiooxidans]